MKKKIIMGVLCFFIAFSALMIFLALNLSPLQLKKDTFVYEYGKTEISTNVADYIIANQKVISQAKLNFTEVKNEIGVYPASVSYLNKEYPFYVKVVDTIKPVVKLKQVQFNFKKGTTVEAIDLLESVEDKSDIVAYFNTKEGEMITSKFFDKEGVYLEYIVVVDSSDNYSASLRVKIVIGDTVVNKPTLSGIDNITISLNEEFDPLKGVEATDGKGNDITDSIKIIKNNVNTKEAGIYEVIYTVTNSSNQSLQRSRKVVVK